MSEDMLGNISLSELRGLRDQVEDRLTGAESEEWQTRVKRFLRGENVFGSNSVIQLEKSLVTVGFSDEDIAKLAGNVAVLFQLEAMIRGNAKIQILEHVLDFDKPCRLPFTGAEVEIHRGIGLHKLERRGDDLFLDKKKIELYLSPKQKEGKKSIEGHDLRKELEKRGRNLPGKFLDCVEDNPSLWPESWKKNSTGNTIYVFAWDDIFRDADGRLYVRYAYWRGGRVVSLCRWLDLDWRSGNPAASPAS